MPKMPKMPKMTANAQQQLTKLRRGETLGININFARSNIDRDGYFEIMSAIMAIPGYAKTIISLDFFYNNINLTEYHFEDFLALNTVNLRNNYLATTVRVYTAPDSPLTLKAYFVNVVYIRVPPLSTVPIKSKHSNGQLDGAVMHVYKEQMSAVTDRLDYEFVPSPNDFVIVSAPEDEMPPQPVQHLKIS